MQILCDFRPKLAYSSGRLDIKFVYLSQTESCCDDSFVTESLMSIKRKQFCTRGLVEQCKVELRMRLFLAVF